MDLLSLRTITECSGALCCLFTFFKVSSFIGHSVLAGLTFKLLIIYMSFKPECQSSIVKGSTVIYPCQFFFRGLSVDCIEAALLVSGAIPVCILQSNLDSSNFYGSFTMANSNSFLSLYEVLPIAQENKYLGKCSYFIVKLYVVSTH